ncbi:MAG: hypothetical protein GWM90_31980, partial [Gemmatimonadetes bacterium]|nr:hypothetical protein [Gemmatimonadota bacterium]NIQ59896.1 hypothetical protein [Gemmatimonadota bacterium]NIU80089.1 hypothetical protein [Gammaproteobacteria bacterium]NIX48509.1 hypothetical protein [Gemmatimonadota bacterium]
MVRPTVQAGAYVFHVDRRGARQTWTVDGVVGGGHMVGGGTQGFLTRADDGTVRFLPFDWSRTDGVWFCNTGTRPDTGWVPITRDMRLADCGDWPPRRIMGHHPRFANCQECHGSQIRVAFDSVARAYRTDWTTLTVNCESCHGPARRHVERMRAGDGGPDIGLSSLAMLDTDASLRVCFRCHALKDAVRPGWLPGAGLE